MSMALSLLFPLLFLSLPLSQTQTPPKGFLIDCGAHSKAQFDDRAWLPDSAFISSGQPRNLTTPGLSPTLRTLRSFPRQVKKHCYKIPVYRGARYLVRSTYFYGGVNGADHPSPPVFDQILDGTLWTVVNTTEGYANGDSTFYEGVFLAQGKIMSFCIASNTYTDSDPFISALELLILGDSLYNTTDFTAFALALFARHSFGYSGPPIRYPDDGFDRIWEPFGLSNSTKASTENVSLSGFWNLPPAKIFETHIGSNQLESLELRWPTASLQSSKYYIALYFADDTAGSRTFNISVNGITYYHNLNVIPSGVVVFANQWPLSGPTTVTLTPAPSSSSGPLINAGEVFGVLPLGGRTTTGDVIALEKVKESLQNPPLDWNGDPCMPRQYSWTGITCSEGPRIRVVTLNLTSMDLSGSLSPFVANMTALANIWLGNNSLSGQIPDLSSLKNLETLHLENNQFSGGIPSSLGDISSLQEVFLQNNNLTGQIPANLIGKPGLIVRTSGNNFLSPPAP
ncbi:leucine-rich repeat receptor-like serine/threonine-protein kinase At2g14510 isoform X1 [Cajanus cajan]|uniref:LRR receptor-like serine/threonine-protein kinase At1g67720 family n=1 Tax=Cajanus cajan TaxID=3821 RepID=A0A151U6Z1_CAJCA|nr:leucine-rich repeat receptor-like serine/threonine-protein kinase At2g14510 isoform X1 [Cajanus cajan]KYP75047.1 putative LRR receptor-like serine/threonine-protein kinase At1g67720 family [Cajanus cajan]